MKILNQTKNGEIGITKLEEDWLTKQEADKLLDIRKSGLEMLE